MEKKLVCKDIPSPSIGDGKAVVPGKNKTVHDFINERYDSSEDQLAKKNRDNKARELREQGYTVYCGRTTSIRDEPIYLLDADKEIEETIESPVSLNEPEIIQADDIEINPMDSIIFPIVCKSCGFAIGCCICDRRKKDENRNQA